jgi:hypothetical protein
MDAGDQLGCLRMCHLSESYLNISGVPYHSNYTCPTPLPGLHQLEQSPTDMQGPWIHKVVSILVHVHLLDTIGNETCQTRQHVSSHQQSNVSVDGTRQGKLCVVLSARVYEWAFGSEILYR